MDPKSRHPAILLAGAVLLLGTVCAISLCGCSEKTEKPEQIVKNVENDDPPVFPAVPAKAKSVLDSWEKNGTPTPNPAGSPTAAP